VIGAANKFAGVFGHGSPGVLGMGIGDALAIQAFGGLGSLGTSTVPAGNFVGTVTVLGDFKVAGGSKQFVIDHPLDPDNRYLQHAAVEAPALKTLYDGRVTLDQTGQAQIALPDWFDSLNSDLCYSLTSVGSPAPELHVAQEYDGSAFIVAGGPPAGQVCWQVTGVRKDPSALAHPLIVEQTKEADNVGRYADPGAVESGSIRHLQWAARLIEGRDALEEIRNP
jgi:hypothetical protein